MDTHDTNHIRLILLRSFSQQHIYIIIVRLAWTPYRYITNTGDIFPLYETNHIANQQSPPNNPVVYCMYLALCLSCQIRPSE